jgi:hypothetical protein
MAGNIREGRGGIERMTDIEQWEPSSTEQALAVLDEWTAALDKAQTVEEVTTMRGEAEAVFAWVRRRNESHAVELRAQEFIRNAERKLAELMEELKAAGKVRGAGRPKKQSVNDLQDTEGEPVNDLQVSAREIFGDPMVQRDALLFASINEDEWNEAIAAARDKGDLSRKALVRMLRTPREHRAATDSDGDIPTVGQVVPKAVRALTGVADALSGFDAGSIEHEDRKEWKATIREQIVRIDQWQKALPR